MTSRLAFVESPVQLLNVLEWAHASTLRPTPTPAPRLPAVPRQPARRGSGAQGPVTAPGQAPAGGPGDPAPDGSAVPAPSLAHVGLTIVVLSPTDPMSRGQLRRMAQLARDEGVTVKWQEARQGKGAVVSTLRELAGPLRAAERVIVGDPFSRYVQLLLTLYGPRRVTVVDDGTATMEFAAQLARGERLVRWHRRGGSRGPRELVLAPVTSLARRKLAPGPRRTVEIFTSLPVEPPAGTTVTVNDFAWTRSRFGPPRLTRGADLVGTSLVETGVVDPDEYLRAVTVLARTHGATRYFAHRRESAEKLHRIAVETGLEVVRPDLPLELIARRGPIGRTIVSFPSTVVHTLPLALAGTGVKVAVCEIAPEWLRANASPRAQGFLSGVAGTATGTERLEFG
ncbi:hypothetical protein KV205_34755 [Streptomyces sp. SKN60]|uniref:hypothetical protein n=1 Tax=Streptomyces sp. SKN60 TaxID=2855506 RepID=UPI002247748D|nr:hypothetical protein [Streptomyces sp. SKN60]MCX2185635.1 hypothetical protein [Streptomyces sp. SKN60]